ncbi:uncharacterized protein G2W53_001549 [Senna tora]|uniref:Uncharacterized protein n=1 Tax=Senna tora TaxID=362788 RepID=A0A834XG48_9FABA|nr:uncharacterized protein G2W53_001549 [Senna tora]
MDSGTLSVCLSQQHKSLSDCIVLRAELCHWDFRDRLRKQTNKT